MDDPVFGYTVGHSYMSKAINANIDKTTKATNVDRKIAIFKESRKIDL